MRERRGQRVEREREATALAGYARAFDPDAPAHVLDHLLADIQPQAGAAHGTNHIAFEPHKFTKQEGNIFRRNARPAILDADQHF